MKHKQIYKVLTSTIRKLGMLQEGIDLLVGYDLSIPRDIWHSINKLSVFLEEELECVERRMKRTCSGCRAFWRIDPQCKLGYRIEPIGHSNEYRPVIECPKPLTYNAMIAARQSLREGGKK